MRSWRASLLIFFVQPASAESTALSAIALTAYRPLRKRGDIDWIHTRHEEPQLLQPVLTPLTGALAVCAGSCGPGNLHFINGLSDVHRTGVPVLAIAAQIPSAEIGSGYFQETRPDQLFRECSHYCELISHPSQLPAVLEAAMRQPLAIGESRSS